MKLQIKDGAYEVDAAILWFVLSLTVGPLLLRTIICDIYIPLYRLHGKNQGAKGTHDGKVNEDDRVSTKDAQSPQKSRPSSSSSILYTPLTQAQVKDLTACIVRLEQSQKESEKRWEEREKRWEEREKRWEEREKRWEKREKRWEESQKRWEESQKLFIQDTKASFQELNERISVIELRDRA